MSKLPPSPLATGTHTVNGVEVAIRSLSRTEAIRMQSFEGHEEDAEVHVVASGTDTTEDEAREWLASVDLETGGELIEAILRLSGLLDPRAGSTRAQTSNEASSEP